MVSNFICSQRKQLEVFVKGWKESKAGLEEIYQEKELISQEELSFLRIQI